MSLLGDPASFTCNRCLPVDWAARSKVCQGLPIAKSELLGHYQANEPGSLSNFMVCSLWASWSLAKATAIRQRAQVLMECFKELHEFRVVCRAGTSVLLALLCSYTPVCVRKCLYRHPWCCWSWATKTEHQVPTVNTATRLSGFMGVSRLRTCESLQRSMHLWVLSSVGPKQAVTCVVCD